MSSPKFTPSIEMRDSILAAYMAEILKIPGVTAAEERDLLGKARAGDRQALNDLVSSHLKFVVAVSWNFRRRGLSLPDLINEGNLALFRAAEHFDLGNPVRFMSYAVWWIRQGMLDALARQAGSITFPPDRMHKAARFRRVEIALTQKLGRPPVPEELTSATRMSARSARSLLEVSEGISSTRGSGPSYASALDGIAQDGNAAGVDADASRYLVRKAVKSLLDRLAPREQRILSLRFGLAHEMRLSLAEVGSIMGITRERVRQIEERAISSLRIFARKISF